MTPTEAIGLLEELERQPDAGNVFGDIADVIQGLVDDAILIQAWADGRNATLTEACKLVLLFHSGSPWTPDKQSEWDSAMDAIMPPLHSNEATTKNLCDAVRTALKTT